MVLFYESGLYLPAGICLAVIVLFIVFALTGPLRANKLIRKLKKDLHFNSDTELDKFLSDCNNVGSDIYISERYLLIIGVQKYTLLELSRIESVSKYTDTQGEFYEYGIHIKLTDNKTESFKCFVNEIEKIAKSIQDAADKAAGKKYID